MIGQTIESVRSVSTRLLTYKEWIIEPGFFGWKDLWIDRLPVGTYIINNPIIME